MKFTQVAFPLLILFTLISCKPNTGAKDDGGGNDSDLNGYNDKTFFKTDGQEILNRQGEPVVIKGFGLGGWLLPEGYMFNISAPDGGSPTSIRRQIEDLIGPSDTEEWFQLFRDNYVREADIIAMKEWGADHIRFPFHYNLFYDIDTDEFIDEGFDRLDQLLVWCKRHRVDVILDMHAAPGAQNDGPISDSDGTARLWTESETYWPITVKVWEEIARQYKDETIIIGYDLINEPVTPDGYGGRDLARLYGQLTSAIRKIDENHILFIEGNYYATTFDFLYPPFDDNMVYAFHKYWNETDQGTINYLLDIRSEYNVPLWLGESGENSNPWFYETIKLMESNNIGWNWWTHKKLETITSPLSAPTNDNYEKVLAYWRTGNNRPSVGEARDGLFQMAEDLQIDNTTLRPDVLASLFSPSFGNVNEPFEEHTIPGKIKAVNYDIGNNGVSYNDLEYKRVSSDDAQNTGNAGWEYRNDGVDIESSQDPANEYNVGFTDSGEWMEYTVDVTPGTYNITARIASAANNSKLRLYLGSAEITDVITVPNTGGYQNWTRLNLGTAELDGGTQILRLAVVTGGFNITELNFD